MSIELGLALAGFAVTAGGVAVNALYLMRRVTQSESQIKNSIAGVQVALGHQNDMATMRHDDLSRRVGRVEQTLGSITKVVIFDGKTP